MAAASASACLCPAAANGETPAPPPGLSPVSPVSPVSIINVVQGFLLSGCKDRHTYHTGSEASGKVLT
eukprot:3633279-Pyramimonas_sp.AAC.1